MHPLISDLSSLSNEELHKKHNDLVAKLNQAYKFGPSGAIPQLQMILENYRTEFEARNRKVIEDMEAKNDKFEGIIDIK